MNRPQRTKGEQRDHMTSQLEKQLLFDMNINEQRADELAQQLRAFNQTHFAQWEQNHHAQMATPLHIFAFNAQGVMIGGLTGRTNAIYTWLEISIIWVKEEWRRQGIGKQLMQQAEAEAHKRGCLYARLATSHYQAPGFYEKLGYGLYGKLENCPPGEISFYYYKCLPKETQP